MKKKAVQNLKVKMPIKWKNELNVIVDEEHDAIKHLKEYCDIDDIEPPWKDKAVCKTCMKKRWLEKHIQEKYTKLLWNYCGQMYK